MTVYRVVVDSGRYIHQYDCLSMSEAEKQFESWDDVVFKGIRTVDDAVGDLLVKYESGWIKKAGGYKARGGASMANKVFIDGRRNGYAPDQCGKTMTVGELIEMLSGFDDDSPVYLRNDGGYTYGNIDWSSFEEEEPDEEEAE